MIGRTLGGATVAVMQGLLVTLVCVIAGFRPVHLATVPLALGFMVLIATVFAALGVAIGSSLQDMQGFQLIMNFLVMPIFFLSGALFPLDWIAEGAAQLRRMVDPLSYGVDGMRAVLLGGAHFGAMIDLEVLVVVAAVLHGVRGVSFLEDRDLDMARPRSKEAHERVLARRARAVRRARALTPPAWTPSRRPPA